MLKKKSNSSKYILAIDQGTTSTRAIIFDDKANIKEMSRIPIKQYYPQSGWVEQDANEIWLSVLGVINEIFTKGKIKPQEISSIGLTNQRETAIVWNKKTGKPIYNAICWQSRQSAGICDDLVNAGYEQIFKDKTGLKIDSYFSATKIKWILDNQANNIEQSELLFGTVDSWILWNLAEQKPHLTDRTNASRTMLYNIVDLKWDDDLLKILKIDKNMLPDVKNSAYDYGTTAKEFFFGKSIRINAIVGDQQAALFGQACFEKGALKNTYGTGCFLLMNTGKNPVFSNNGLLTTIAATANEQIEYALEGSVFVAGSGISWLEKGMEFIKSSSECQRIIDQTPSSKGVYVVPTFVGVATPFWDQEVRGGIHGLTMDCGKNEIIRATIEAIAYQSRDIIEVMEKDAQHKIHTIKADGGLSNNHFLMQFQADILNENIKIPDTSETTALGAAYLSGLHSKIWKNRNQVIDLANTKTCSYSPKMEKQEREILYNGWKKALTTTMKFKN